MIHKFHFILLLILALAFLSCESQDIDDLLAPRPPTRRPPPPRRSPPPPPRRSPPPPPRRLPPPPPRRLPPPPPRRLPPPPPRRPPPPPPRRPPPPPPRRPPPPPPLRPPPPPPPQYSSFKLVMHWPPTYCKQKSCRQTPGRFTIHGLWPQNPAYAGSDQLTDAILSSHRTDLLRYWPDLATTSFEQSKAFWRYQYDKHGLYCTTKFTAAQYIAKALALGKAHDIRAYLTAKSIRPDNYRQYDASAIIDAVRNRTSFTPDLQCITVQQRCYLLEVRLCYNSDATRLINCAGASGGCQPRIYYPEPPESKAFEEIPEIAEDVANLIEVI